MAMVNKCDRCGKINKVISTSEVRIIPADGYSEKYDLCPRCSTLLGLFLSYKSLRKLSQATLDGDFEEED